MISKQFHGNWNVELSTKYSISNTIFENCLIRKIEEPEKIRDIDNLKKKKRSTVYHNICLLYDRI